jgi:hypothetical protein
MGNRTTFVVKYLNDHYRIHLPRAIARGIVVEYLYLVADHFRIDRYRAQRFLTDEALRASALDILGSPPLMFELGLIQMRTMSSKRTLPVILETDGPGVDP